LLAKEDLKKLARERLKDAESLFHAGRYDGAVYVCGYAVELALKHRICKTLKWDDYPASNKLNNFKTHDLDLLLLLSGVKKKINAELWAEWSGVSGWTSELRYKPAGNVTKEETRLMIEAAKTLLKRL